MTGFGQASKSISTERGELEISVEIKSLNSRFLDFSLRSPRAYLSLDQKIQSHLKTYFLRGRVEVYVNRRVLDGYIAAPNVNSDQVKALVNSYQEALRASGLSAEIQFRDLLNFPDWIESREASIDMDEEWSFLKSVLGEAAEATVKARQTEGQSLQKNLQSFVKQMQEILPSIGEKNSESVLAMKKRLKEKIQDLAEDTRFDPERLEQEVSIWVARADYQEELDRLAHHLESMNSMIQGSGETGRKLDFLIQEIHRELNTMGSKAVDALVTQEVIELKSILEKLREQVQNIE